MAMPKIEYPTIVYGWKNKLDKRKVYPGFSPSSKGEDYISSTINNLFWEAYQRGELEKSVLFVAKDNSKKETTKAETMEWFAQKYSADVLGKDNVYHKVNGHCVDESLLTPIDKQVVIDWVENGGKGISAEINTGLDEDKLNTMLNLIVDNINNKVFPSFDTSIAEISKFGEGQNRLKMKNEMHINALAKAMNENPDEFDAEFDPIVVVFRDGVWKIYSGIHRAGALPKVKGRNTAPVIFLDESVFGDTPEEIDRNLDVFGARMNPESQLRLESNDDDKQFWVQKAASELSTDIDSIVSQQHLRDVMIKRYYDTKVVKSKTTITSAVKKWLDNQHMNVALAKYDGQNLLAYDKAYLTRMTVQEEQKGVATIINTAKSFRLNAAFGFVCNRMRTLHLKKGLIVLYYADMRELHKWNSSQHLPSLLSLINFFNLDIEVKILPAFDE
jgi:hypothetical protein